MGSMHVSVVVVVMVVVVAVVVVGGGKGPTWWAQPHSSGVRGSIGLGGWGRGHQLPASTPCNCQLDIHSPLPTPCNSTQSARWGGRDVLQGSTANSFRMAVCRNGHVQLQTSLKIVSESRPAVLYQPCLFNPAAT
jgi:hypothetical protein